MTVKLPEELQFIQNGAAPQKKWEGTMHGKTCVITGGTSGVGLEAVKQYVLGGANIVLVCRNLKKAQQLIASLENPHQVDIKIIVADFSNLDQVRQAANQVLEQTSNIDVLINSAGLHSTRKTYTDQGFETVFCVNHLASFLFTYLLMERIIASGPARIIQVSSEGHRFNGLRLDDLNWKKRHYTGLRGYGASKTAQLYTVWKWAKLLEGTQVTINAMHPGNVKTQIGANNGKLYNWFLHNVTWHFLTDAKVSGEALYYLGGDPALAQVSGKFFNITVEEKPAKHALRSDLEEIVWNKTLEMCGLTTPTEKEEHHAL
ncbi:MAG: SDR family NAD(P)-dependent oxidoreductase [Erysipelotrichaceae bacterium]